MRNPSSRRNARLLLSSVGLLLGACAVPYSVGRAASRDGEGARPAPVPSQRAAPQPAAFTGPLGREDLVRQALAASPDLAAAQARSRRAQAAVDVARAALRPSLSLRLEGLRADAPSLFLFKRIDARDLPPDTDFNRPGAFSSFEAGLELRQNLWDGGRDRLRLGRARAGDDAGALELDAARAELVAAILDGHHALLAAGEAIGVAERSVEVVEAQLERVRSEHELGRALRSDVLSLEVRLAEAREVLVLATTARELASATLLDAAGLPPSMQLELAADSLPSLADEARVLPPEPDEHEILARALRLRPELEAARRRAREAELAVRETRAAWAPRADLFGRVYRVDDSLDLFDSDDAWAVGVVLGWDVLAGGRRGAELEVARAGELEARALERRTRLAVELDVRAALLRLRSARGRVVASRWAAELADENLGLVLAQYENGRVPVTRYLEAEAALLGARLRRIEAHHDLGRAQIQLARAGGALLEPGGSWIP